MNKNSTPTGKRIISKPDSTSRKIAVVAIAILLSLSINVSAQNTDLSNPDANIQTAPAGSLIIAMDNTNQANPGYFNLKAYGLVTTLMDYGLRLRWVITAGKVKDGVDISVNASSITTPTVVTASAKMTCASGTNVATLSNVDGTLMVGMSVTVQGYMSGTTILNIIDPTHITLSTNATSTLNNKSATFSIDTYPVLNYDFKAGPFIIFPADTMWASWVINDFNSTQATTDQVNVFRTTASASVDIRYDMIGVRPKAALLNDGGNASIHETYMINAAIPTMNYQVFPSATGLTSNCFTFASEAHNSLQGAFIDSIKSFVTLGGNFLAECHALIAYENWGGGYFQSTNGINNTNANLNNNVNYLNSDLAISQYEGEYDPNQGGSAQTWVFNSGSVPQNNFFGIINGNTTALANTYGASGIKLGNGKGGLVYFLGNHDLHGNQVKQINGQRMYLNAFLTPAATPACDAARLLAVKLNYFAAKKVNVQQVQLTWSTASEENVKEFIIERSADGINFSEINRVTAKGNSTIEVKYNSFDNMPLTGKNFYRMITMDLDGKKSYSDIVMLNMGGVAGIAVNKMDIYPNPAHGQVTVNLTDLPLYNNTLTVIDMAGVTVISNQAVNGNSIKLNINSLTAGSYIVKVTTADGTVVQNKLMVISAR